ncbi:MAG: bis(5'-nucleosyl)-tetraphosphatase (symmetrical) YqeK [Bacillota bacterium]
MGEYTYYTDKLSSLLSEARYNHSLNVSETAVRLARVHGVDTMAAKIAGLFHDYARDFSDEKLVEIAEAHGLVSSEVELYQPMLLHAPVGAYLVREEFDIKEPEILQAIARHTVGAPKMTHLEKVIYIADMIEPEREFDGVENLRLLAYNDLDRAILQALDYTIDYVVRKQQLIHPQSVRARNYLILAYSQIKTSVTQGKD